MDKRKISIKKPLSHAYIVSGSGKAAEELSLTVATALLCSEEREAPCGRCRDCRKAAAGLHPDLIIIEPELTESGAMRDYTVKRMRALVADAQVMPNEAGRKVYLIWHAEKLSVLSQNALLKAIEEPPARVAFVLCAENAGVLLPTLRSRCVLLRENAEEAVDGAALSLAEEFISLCAAGSRTELLRWCTAHEGMSLSETGDFVEAARGQLSACLTGGGRVQISARRCMELSALLSKCAMYLKQNTGVKHVLGLLAVDGIGGN